MSTHDKSGFKGIFIMRACYGVPELGEALLHFGGIYRRGNDKYDDEYICYRIGDKTNQAYNILPGDACFYEGYPELEPGTKEWHAWIKWCFERFDKDIEE